MDARHFCQSHWVKTLKPIQCEERRPQQRGALFHRDELHKLHMLKVVAMYNWTIRDWYWSPNFSTLSRYYCLGNINCLDRTNVAWRVHVWCPCIKNPTSNTCGVWPRGWVDPYVGSFSHPLTFPNWRTVNSTECRDSQPVDPGASPKACSCIEDVHRCDIKYIMQAVSLRVVSPTRHRSAPAEARWMS